MDLRTVLSVLLEKIALFLPCPAATTVLLSNKETGELERIVCRNLDEQEWKSRQHVKPGFSIQVAETRMPLAIRNIQTDPRTADPAYFRENGLVSYLGIPMVVKEETVGVLSFYTREEHDFTPEQIEFLSTLAGQAAIAIHNAQIYDDMVRSNKVKDEFLSVMSHELRTPLNVVMGYTAMLRDRLLGDVNPKQDEALGKIIGRANDQLAMVNNILYATVLEAQKLKIEHQPVVLGDLLNQLKSTFEAILEKPLALKWDCADPLVVVHTDGSKLKQALQNLIDNAIKFTDKGSVTVSARVTDSPLPPGAAAPPPSEPGSKGRWVEFKVTDTGTGIPETHLPFVFERFRQVDSSETRLYGGVGLGLYIAKKFTELLGGKVTAASKLGEGSTFTVWLPYET